ncbi:DUF3489 domain-containing protein [Novosphingobium aquiterrae]|uniref:DUF3489 domain-containing protein n=1 Tax=Novosphingobium aquiterrae TaxID=624388 RepID=A0ABV6PLG8_9SPHN
MTDSSDAIALATKPHTKRPRKMAREPMDAASGGYAAAEATSTPTKRKSKADQVLSLLKRPEGATIDQLVAATGWLPHTTRAALTGLKKKGHAVTSEKLQGQGRVYRLKSA